MGPGAFLSLLVGSGTVLNLEGRGVDEGNKTRADDDDMENPDHPQNALRERLGVAHPRGCRLRYPDQSIRPSSERIEFEV